MGRKTRGKGIKLGRDGEYDHGTPEQDSSMIDKWLKKNKPSTRFEDEPPMPTASQTKKEIGWGSTGVGGATSW